MSHSASPHTDIGDGWYVLHKLNGHKKLDAVICMLMNAYAGLWIYTGYDGLMDMLWYEGQCTCILDD